MTWFVIHVKKSPRGRLKKPEKGYPFSHTVIMVQWKKTLNNEISTLQGPIFHWIMIVGAKSRQWKSPKNSILTGNQKRSQIEKKQTGRIPILLIQAVPLSSPSWRSLDPLKGSRFHHPKNVTLNHLDIRILHIPGFFVHLDQVAFFVIFPRVFCPFLGSPDLPLHLVKLFRMGVFPKEWRWKNLEMSNLTVTAGNLDFQIKPPWNLCWH